MNDVAMMGGVECVCDLDGYVEKLVKRKRAGGEEPVERLSFEQFHGDVGPAVVFTAFVNDADVFVIERRGGARFALKTLERHRVGIDVGHELESDVATEFRVFGFIDDAHAAGAESAKDLVVSYGGSNHSGRNCTDF
jgi:hypothetical protein